MVELDTFLSVQGQLNEVKSLFRRAVDIFRALLSAQHPVLAAQAITQIAQNLELLAQYDLAVAIHREAFEILEDFFGGIYHMYLNAALMLSPLYVLPVLSEFIRQQIQNRIVAGISGIMRKLDRCWFC